ncbi:MAG: BPSS1780 family membrane protein [Pseudomonadota bacterium]
MEKIPASAGWLWITEGTALFRKQPGALCGLFLTYMFLIFFISILPLIGKLLPMMLVPTFSIAFRQACFNIEQGETVTPALLLTGFRSPAFKRLLMLGVLYIVAASVAVGASVLIDGGIFWKLITGQIAVDSKTAQQANLLLPMMFSAAIYLPAAMAFWHVAPLMAWQNMGLGKAIFYSFFAVKRAGTAFLVFAFAWVGIGIFLPSVLSVLLAVITGKKEIVLLLILPMSIIMTVIMYCSFYATYTAVFPRPDTEKEAV